jgi:hypothetical protein
MLQINIASLVMLIVTMVKLFIIVKLLMAKQPLIKLNVEKKDGIINCG